MSDEPRRVLRPVELSPEEAAAVYDFYHTGQMGRERVHHWSDLLRKIEAAMVPEEAAPTPPRSRGARK